MHGAVGNDAAMPVYQHLKQPAERLDTVRLAAHPGFGTKAVSVTPPDELNGLLTDYRHLAIFQNLAAVQTGYFGQPSQIDPVARFITESQAAHSQLVLRSARLKLGIPDHLRSSAPVAGWTSSAPGSDCVPHR
ncbi:MAG: hypothetical protein ACPGRU_04795, partial [Candidatus Puniceispirillaceae bacterium]